MVEYGVWASIALFLGVLLFIGIILLNRGWRAAGELVYPPRRLPATTPADYGLDAQAISFKTHDGLLLRGWLAVAPGKAKGTIVLSHGYAGDCSPDLIYAGLFNRAGYNVCLFDYRGHGASEGDFTSLVRYERDDLLAALEYLRSRGIRQVGLLGFSMGGAITLAAAPRSPMVIAVASDCTFSELSSIIRNAAIQRGLPPVLARFFAWLIEFMASIRLRANLFAADPIHSVAGISPRPLLIMHGEADEAIPVAEAHRLFQAARAPKELWIVPGARHRRIEDVEPDEYKRRVVEFFDRAFAQVENSTRVEPIGL